MNGLSDIKGNWALSEPQAIDYIKRYNAIVAITLTNKSRHDVHRNINACRGILKWANTNTSASINLPAPHTKDTVVIFMIS